MKFTRADIIKTRLSLLRDMHKYIIDIGDEELYEWWIAEGVPDDPSEEDFEYIANVDKEWVEVCDLFGRITKEAGK